MEYLIIGLLIYFLISRALIISALYFVTGGALPDLPTEAKFLILLHWTCPIWADFLYLGVIKRLIQALLGIEIRE